jgi:hypothetical protein
MIYSNPLVSAYIKDFIPEDDAQEESHTAYYEQKSRPFGVTSVSVTALTNEDTAQ